MENISKLFDSISNRYDRFNHITSLGIDRIWRRQAVRSLPFGEKVLDVAAGTADLSIELIRQGKAHQVVGVDISEGMMEIGREKIEKEKMGNSISLLYADCAQLPFQDNTFDAITCAYGARNFQQLTKSLQEMLRVLKPGGSLLIVEFSYPTLPVVRQAYDLYFTHLMPLIGKLLTGDDKPFRYFLGSVKAFAKGEDFLQMLRETGFSETRYTNQTFGISTYYSACKR